MSGHMQRVIVKLQGKGLEKVEEVLMLNFVKLCQLGQKLDT